MGKLKPIGSEKLTGQDKVARIMEIARYGEVTKNKDYHVASQSFTKSAADGNVYSIVQEKDGYYLKSGINESELEYVSGFMNKKRDRFKSYSSALKRMNLIFKPLNEEYNEGMGDGMYDETDLEEQEKFVLNVPNEGDEELDLDVEDDMGDEELDLDVEDDMGDEELDLDVEDDMGTELEGDEDMEGFMKSIQKLTGKLGQKLRDVEEEMGSADIKYVLNSIISAVDLENLDDEDKDDVLDRFEEDETTYGDEEGMDMGDEEVDLDMDLDVEDDMGGDEVDLGMEDEEEFAMESLKKRVGNLLESYITEKKTKSVTSKNYLKSRISNAIREKKIVEGTNTIEQSLTVKKILNENNELRLEGQTKRGDVVLTSKNKKVIVKKDGSIK